MAASIVSTSNSQFSQTVVLIQPGDFLAAYMSHPAHIEIVLAKDEDGVKKEDDEGKKPLRLTKKRQAQLRQIKIGGDM